MGDSRTNPLKLENCKFQFRSFSVIKADVARSSDEGNLRLLTGVLAGHSVCNKHVSKLWLTNSSTCSYRCNDEESMEHLITECEALAQTKCKLLESFILEERVTSAEMDYLNGQSHRCSLSNNSFLAYRSSGNLAHRLSIIMPALFSLSKNPQQLICELNSHVASFREILIQIGQSKDNQELRKEIRKSRKICMEASQLAVHGVTIVEHSNNGHSTCLMAPLLCLLQLFSKELVKNYRLIDILPLDMSKHNENRNRSTNFSNAIGQILLGKEITPDFNQEELCSIENDASVIDKLMLQLITHMPQTDDSLEECNHLQPNQNETFGSSNLNVDRKLRKSAGTGGLLCCVSGRQ